MFKGIKKSIGLDISDRTVEAVELEMAGADIKIVGLGRVKIERGVVERGRVMRGKKLAEAVKSALRQAKAAPAGKVIFGLPESQTYIHIFTAPRGRKEWTTADNYPDIGGLVKREALSTIPLPKKDLLYVYRIIGGFGGVRNILLAAASRRVVGEWREFFTEVNLAVEIFDIECLAVFRGIFKNFPREAVCLLDVGAATTNLSIFTSAGLAFSHTIGMAGDFLTERLASGLKIDFARAERGKIKDGLLSPKAAVVLKDFLAQLVSEINDDFGYWRRKSGKDIQKIILLGGTGAMPGLLDYLKNKINPAVKIELAAPLITTGRSVFKYIEAIGLARRGLVDEWEKTDPYFPAAENSAGAVNSDGPVLPIIRRLRKMFVFAFKSRNSRIFIAVLVAVIFLFLLFFINSGGERRAKPVPEDGLNAERGRVQREISTSSEKIKSVGGERKRKIRIKDIGANLNVRSGPGMEYKIIGKAIPLSVYELTEKSGAWDKVKISTGTVGWIFAGFTEGIK